MSDILVVVRKELLELLGERQSLRGAAFQALGTLLTTGVLVPFLDGRIWDKPASLVMIYLVFPCMIAGSVAGDAFAGERERKTLETLLATPLREFDIFAGKALAAVVFGVAVSAVSLGAAVAIGIARGRPVLGTGLWPLGVVAILGGAWGAASLVSAVAITVSSRVAVARAVQQIVPFLTMTIVGIVSAVLGWLGVELDWYLMLEFDVVLAGLGLMALWVSSATFGRGRLFDAR